ncbi:non-ribosomal peptide synthetase, partial [Pseudoalteromonas rubra]
GHSLLAVRLIARIREQLGRELTIKQLFDQPSIKALADELSRQETTPARPSIISHGPNSRAPLSFSQQRLWFIDQLQSGVSTNYNLPMVLRLHGPFEPGCAEQALSYMIARHEILRTVYHYDGQEVEQVIQAEAAFTIERIDLQGLSAQAQQAACEEAIERTVSQAFDLSCDIPIRATWVALSPQQGVLIFNMHHIASDGWSMGVLAEEFSQLYRQACAGEPLMLAPLDIQYGDYARWQRTYLQGPVLDTQLNYWLAHLAEVPPVHGLALDRPRGQQASEGALFSQSLDSELAEQLRGLCQRLAITPFMLLHGILSLVLARHSGSHDIVVGTPVANRLQAQLAPLIGFFVNTLVLRVNTAGHTDIQSYLAHIKDV